MPYAGVNGQRLYYEVGGEGDLILLVHGSFADADIMEAPATGLASGFRALRIDRRSHGRSTAADAPFSLADEVADLAALLDWFSVSSTHFLSHDDGSEVVLEFALRHPERVLSLGFLAPTVEGFPWSAEAQAARASLASGLRADYKGTLERQFLPASTFDVVRDHEGMFDRIAAMYLRGSGAAAAHDRAPHGEAPQWERLWQIKARAGIFVGDRDEPERLMCASSLKQGLSSSELVVFPGLSRYLHIEESRTVMRRLTDFYLPEPEIER